MRGGGDGRLRIRRRRLPVPVSGAFPGRTRHVRADVERRVASRRVRQFDSLTAVSARRDYEHKAKREITAQIYIYIYIEINNIKRRIYQTSLHLLYNVII